MAKGRFAFASAPERSLALGEVHARPTVLLAPSRIIVQLAFMMDGGSVVHHSVIAEMSRSRGVAPPERDARHHAMPWGQGTLRWERHTEFSTWFWDGPAPEKFGGDIAGDPFGDGFSPPGSLISGVRLEIRNDNKLASQAETLFEPTSLCHSDVRDGQAAILTDFRQDRDG